MRRPTRRQVSAGTSRHRESSPNPRRKCKPDFLRYSRCFPVVQNGDHGQPGCIVQWTWVRASELLDFEACATAHVSRPPKLKRAPPREASGAPVGRGTAPGPCASPASTSGPRSSPSPARGPDRLAHRQREGSVQSALLLPFRLRPERLCAGPVGRAPVRRYRNGPVVDGGERLEQQRGRRRAALRPGRATGLRVRLRPVSTLSSSAVSTSQPMTSS